MERFGEATRAWFERSFEAPTEAQRLGWPRIAAGDHVLLAAPTGSGKTLAAFLAAIDRLSHEPPAEPGVRVLYVSPLKALVYDIDRNLRAPLAGIAAAARDAGAELSLPRVAVRTGDTSSKERRLQAREPAEILVTTPESLYLILTSRARETLRSVDTVIVDEVHALAPSKRGAHLALSLERLAALCPRDPQRIGLSATARPLEEVARFLGGDRRVEVVDASGRPDMDLRVVVPAADMSRPEETALLAPGAASTDTGMWAAIQPAIVGLIREHAQTIVFVNSRSLAERLTHRLNEIAGIELARAHHGSLARAERQHIEEQLKRGELPAIVATSSLELGIDMGAVELVVLVEAPASVASGLQRIGRSGHRVGETSIGRLFPKHRGDLLESAVVAERMRAGAIEAIAVPENPLDVLAQQIVAAVAVDPWDVGELAALVRRAASFRELPDAAYLGTLDMLAGRYPSTAFSELRARIDWDRGRDRLTPRRGAKMLAIIGGGTIPDRGTYAVHLGEDGPRLGELDEEMVNETTPGQVFALGASSWRVERVTRDRVIVSPAPGEIGKLPFWRGDGPGRPVELGRAHGAFVRELEEAGPEAARQRLRRNCGLDDAAADNLLAYLEAQAAESALPTDRRVVIERFRDEVGDFRVCILSPFGARVHAPWALALEARLSAETGLVIQSMWSDDGIVLRFADADEIPGAAELVPAAAEVADRVVDQLGSSAMFAGQFREAAARSLLLPRRRPGERTPLWLQRLKSQQLLSIAREYAAFPIVMEAYRACLKDVFDMGALRGILEAIEAGDIEVREVECASASPFARSLVFAYVAAYLYEGDAPLAERRAQALALDRQLLRELLGEGELRELLDPGVIAALEAELRGGPIESVGDLVDRLRRRGDLTAAEIAAPEIARRAGDRVLAIEVGGEPRFIAAEDAGLYRDALGFAPPPGVAQAFLSPVDDPLGEILSRYARGRGPFTAADVARRLALPEADIEAALARLEADGSLVSGGFRPGERGTEHCDADVLRRIKRRTLAVLRDQVAAAPAAVLGRFLPEWHGVAAPRRGRAALEEAVAHLEGLPLSFAELESTLLPARVADYAPSMLDELGALGWLVWTGREGGRVALYRRENAAALIDPPEPPESLGAAARAVLETLERRGASFFVALGQALPEASSDEILEALWELAWAGLVTNDTFGPLRAQGKRKPSNRRGAARHLARAAGGRWSLVHELCVGAPPETERRHRRAVGWLERHGVLCRESAAIEDAPGGFSAVYPILRAMEEAGRVRRGYFVEGLGGAQFALPGAVDRLRAAASRRPRGALMLAATDPANPFGWLVPWPETTDPTGPRRAAGAQVILLGGEPALFLDRGGKRLVTFPAAAEPEAGRSAATALIEVARRRRGRWLRIATVDGVAARRSPFFDRLLEAGFYADASGVVLEAPR